MCPFAQIVLCPKETYKRDPQRRQETDKRDLDTRKETYTKIYDRDRSKETHTDDKRPIKSPTPVHKKLHLSKRAMHFGKRAIYRAIARNISLGEP